MNKNEIIVRILRRRKRLKHEIEIRSFDTSSIGDLAFLLLIFFIVTASFLLRQGIFFSLPSKSSGSIKIEKKQIIEIYPLNQGFQYNGKVIERDELKQVLIKQKEKIKNCVLFIRMKPNVKYDRLVDMLSVARETGQKRVSLKNAFKDGML